MDGRDMKLDQIKLIVYDFDGVMTDNKVILCEDGKESVVVHRGDGLAISELRRKNIQQVILSTEKNSVVQRRAEKLQIPVIHGVDDKEKTLMKYCNAHGISLKTVAYVGNDINDYNVMMRVGFKICPNDAEREIKEIADIILERDGGQGVVREMLRYFISK